MKRTYQPKKRQRSKVHGFRQRMKDPQKKKRQGQKKAFRITGKRTF